MAEKKAPGFILEKSQKEIFDELTNEEAGIILKAIFEYEETKKVPKLEKTLRIVFKQIKIKLDNYEKAYEERCLKNKENVEKRWAKYKEENDTNEYDRIRANTNYTNINKNKIKENKNKIKERENIEREDEINGAVAPTTHTPTLNEIISFGRSLGLDEDYCKKFFNNYESTGWRAGKNRIENWKAKLEQWASEDFKNAKLKKMPEWFNKEIKKTDVNISEKNEMEELLSGFK